MNTLIPSDSPACSLQSTVARTCLAILLVSSAPGLCNELTIGLDSAYVYDSNFFRSETDEESAEHVDIGGNVTFEREEERFSYLASYIGSYQKYREQEDADAPAHRLQLRGRYDIDPLTTFRLEDRFRDVRNLNFSREDILDGDSGLVPNDDRYQRNDLELTLHRELSRTWELEFNAVHQFIDFDQNLNRSDSESIEIGAQILHRFAPRHRFGGGLSWVTQDFDGGDFRLDAEADFLVADLAWVFDIGEQIQLAVNGGPTWFQTDEDAPDYVQQTQFVGGRQGDEVFRANVRSCQLDNVTGIGIASRCDFITPGAEPIAADDLGDIQNFALGLGTPPVEDDGVTFFGGISLVARYSNWTVDAELRRRQSATSGDALAATVDQFRLDLGYAPPLARWDAYIAGSWERREALSDASIIDYTVIPGTEDAAQRSQVFTRIRDPDDRRDALTALVGVGARFTRRLSGAAEVRFRRTERRVSARESEIDSYFVVVKLSYTFATVRF
jgi:hypothetical protein